MKTQFCSTLYLVFLPARFTLQGRVCTTDSQIALWALKHLLTLYRYQALDSFFWLGVHSIIFVRWFLDILPSLLSNIHTWFIFHLTGGLLVRLKESTLWYYQHRNWAAFCFSMFYQGDQIWPAFSGHQSGKEESTLLTPTFSTKQVCIPSNYPLHFGSDSYFTISENGVWRCGERYKSIPKAPNILK